jgi:hypothetical protein
VTWLILLVPLGFAARSGHRWAFLAGIVLFGADMIALIVLFSWWQSKSMLFRVEMVRRTKGTERSQRGWHLARLKTRKSTR